MLIGAKISSSEGVSPSAPPELLDALAANQTAAAAWDSLTPIGRRDFISWIESAKQEATRLKRVAVAIDKLLRGERRPCCYSRVPLDLYSALKADSAAKAKWGTLSPDDKRDLVDWIESAADRTERTGRIASACAELAAGK